MINQILTYTYIIIFIISLIIRFLLKNNICLLSNKDLCDKPITKTLDNGLTAYSCEKSKIYKPVILSSFFKFIRSIIYIVLICCFIGGSLLIAIETKIINNASSNELLLFYIGYFILLLQLLIWFIITTYCKANNYTCNVDIKLLNENELSDYKFINVDCVSNVKQNILLNGLVSLYSIYDTILLLLIIIIPIFFIIVWKFVEF